MVTCDTYGDDKFGMIEWKRISLIANDLVIFFSILIVLLSSKDALEISDDISLLLDE